MGFSWPSWKEKKSDCIYIMHVQVLVGFLTWHFELNGKCVKLQQSRGQPSLSLPQLEASLIFVFTTHDSIQWANNKVTNLYFLISSGRNSDSVDSDGCMRIFTLGRGDFDTIYIVGGNNVVALVTGLVVRGRISNVSFLWQTSDISLHWQKRIGRTLFSWD